MNHLEGTVPAEKNVRIPSTGDDLEMKVACLLQQGITSGCTQENQSLTISCM